MKWLLVRRSSVQRLLTATIATIGVITAEATILSVQAASLTKWSFDPTANQLEITVKDGTTPRYFLMAQPARIVLDLPDTAVGSVSAQQTYAGAVRQIRVSQFEPGLTRIVMEISPGVSLAPGQVKLQKVGNETASPGNSRWVLQPLITKSLSANAVKPPASPVSPPAVTAPVASTPVARTPKPQVTKPLIAPSSAVAPGSNALATKPSIEPSTSPRVGKPIAPSQAAVSGSNVPSKPTAAIPETLSRPTAESRSDRKPTVVVPDLAAATVPVAPASTPTAVSGVPTSSTATPAQPVVLAPVPPSPPTAVAQTATSTPTEAVPSPSSVAPTQPTQSVALAPVPPSSPIAAPPTVTPLPPTVVTPVDPNVAIDTQRGVAIAVPAPGTLPAVSGVSPKPPAATPQSVGSLPRSAARVEPPIDDRSRATVTPAVVAAPPIVQPSSAPSSAPTSSRLTAAEIPITLSATPTASPPSVSVPPLSTLSAPFGSTSTPEAQIGNPQRQPEASFDIPSSGAPAANMRPTVNVPPPIQVGTPSLGPANAAPSAIEAAPISVFAPNVSITPPVSVPPLQQTPPLRQPAPPTVAPIQSARLSYDANTIRQPTSNADLAPPLNVVPLQAPAQQPTAPLPVVTPGYDADTIKQPPSEVASASIVEFGQPLPAKDSTVRPSQPLNGLNTSQGVRQTFKPTAPDVLLPAGTLLNLRYPGEATLLLQTERPQQEVLVLLTELRDAAGNMLAPAGSAVTGRFETTTSGSQFVTQAIAVAGRTIPLIAQSDMLDGSRKVQGNNLAVNSGIGLVAGGVLGAVSGSAGLGAIGGAAAGAAATLLTAPKPAAIQPGQVVQVRLTQDLRSFE